MAIGNPALTHEQLIAGSGPRHIQKLQRKRVLSVCQRQRKSDGFCLSVGPLGLLCHWVSVSVSASDRGWASALVGTFSRLLDGRLSLQALNRTKSRKTEQSGTDGPGGRASRSSVEKMEPSPGFRGGTSSTSTRSAFQTQFEWDLLA